MALISMRFGSNARLLAASENKPAIKSGEKGAAVAILQMALIDLGFAMPKTTGNGKKLPDGIFGAETDAALKAFQKGNGLTADGVAGKQTLATLESVTVALSEQKAAAQAAAMRFRPASH